MTGRRSTAPTIGRATAQLQTVAGRLETLSPLAVLGRGYAVSWTADKRAVLRDAAAVAPGDTTHRGDLEPRRDRG